MDYFYSFEELSGSQRQERMAHLASELAALIRERGGRMPRAAALAQLAGRLGTQEAEVSRGILLGEGLGIFERSTDGTLLLAR